MAASTTAPTSRVVSENYTVKWQSKNSITDTEVSKKLFMNYGEGYRLVDFLNLAGQKVPISNKDRTIILKDAPLRTFKTGSAIETGTGSVSVTAHADNYDDNDYMALRENWDLIIPSAYLPDGVKEERMYRVMDITGTTVTLRPWNLSGTNLTASQISTEIPSGTELAIGASAFAPGTDQPSGTTDSYTTRTFTPRIMKETIGVEGGQVAQPYYPATGLDKNRGLITEGSIRAEFLLENQMEAFLRDGEINDNTSNLVGTSEFGGSNQIKSGYGVIPLMQIYSPKHYYSASGFTLDDLYDIKLLQENQAVVATINDFFQGPALNVDIEKLGLETISQFSGGTNLYNDIKERLGIEFKAWHFGGKTYIFHVLDSFKNPAQAGINIDGDYTYSYPKIGMVIPREKITAYEFQGEANKTLPNLSIGVVNMHGENREKVYGVMPGMSGFENGNIVANGYDGVKYFWLSHMALLGGGEAKWIMVRKAK